MKIIPELRKTATDEITFQLDVFEDEATDDWQEMLHRWVAIFVHEINVYILVKIHSFQL